MKNFSAFFLAGSLLLGSACGSPPPVPPAQKEDSTGTSFLPVADYLRAEISYVDSSPLAIRKYSTRNNRTDSSFIQPGEFDQLAKEFLTPELATDSFSKNFSENSFMDKTTGTLSFIYSTHDKTLPLRRVDLLAIPGTSTDKVKSIYLEKVFPAGDTLVSKKMFWQMRHSFLILTSLHLAGKAPLVNQLKVVWDTDNPE